MISSRHLSFCNVLQQPSGVKHFTELMSFGQVSALPSIGSWSLYSVHLWVFHLISFCPPLICIWVGVSVCEWKNKRQSLCEWCIFFYFHDSLHSSSVSRIFKQFVKKIWFWGIWRACEVKISLIIRKLILYHYVISK